jgi:hypothetical protein
MNLTHRTYLSPPTVGALLGMSHVSAWRHFDAGDYGPIIRHRGITYAEQAEIERAVGRAFTDEHIAAAVAGFSQRILIIPEQEVV